MFYRLKTKFGRWRFNAACKGISGTPPLEMKAAPLKILTMLSRRDLDMYLLAFKSFYRFLKEGSAVVLNDGSLTRADQDLLRHHIPDIVFHRYSDVDQGVFPQGGCWERLLLLLEYAKQDYVIQLDADTLTTGQIDEVVKCYKAGRNFALGTKIGRQVITVEQASEAAKGYNSNHVQVESERRMRDLRNASSLRYVRATAAFTGFAPQSADRSFLEEFSVQMQQMLGERWSIWGTEQVSSNFLMGNAPDPLVLPHPKYATFRPEIDYKNSSFLHFNGTFRFKNNIYGKKGRAVIQTLN